MRPVRTFDFIVVLKTKSTKTIDTISFLMLALAVSFFSFNLVMQYASAGFSPKLILLLVWIIAIIFWLIYKKNLEKKGVNLNYRFALMIAAWGWFMVNIWYIAVVYLLAAVFENTIKATPEWAFDEKEIMSNTFPRKKYQWKEVSNVVLRFGMLTIDFKNNKILQGEVNDDVPNEVEVEFNEFCQKQLLKQNNSIDYNN